MKLFGSIKELVAAVFRKDGFEIALKPNQTTIYGAAVDVELPQQSSSAVLVSRNSADTLTNKTINVAAGNGNTISNIADPNISATAGIAYSKLASLTSGNILVGSATNVATSTAVSGDVTISNTGVTAIATGVIVNTDINASAGISFSKLASLTSGNILVGSSLNVPTSTAVSGDITISNTGVTAISSGVIVDGDISASAAISDTKLGTISTAGKVSNSATTATDLNTASAIVARDASGNFSAGTITATSFSGPLTGNVTGNVSGTSANVTGTVAIANGGTGQTTQQAAINALVGTQTANRVLRSNGTNMSLSQVALGTDVSGTLPIANGGTGQTTQQAAMNALAGTQTANRVLRSDGTNTTLSQVALTTDVTGTLPVANGGTGITSLGAGVATFLGTPSSANLASAVTDETGSGSLVFGTSPTLSAPQVNSSLIVQQIATPSNPSAGFNKIYTKSDGLLYKLDSAGNEVAVGSGAGGSGEINAVLNPSAATDTTGWAAGTSHTVTKDTANSPLNGIVSTSFAIASSAAIALGSQTSTSGVYDAITLPSGLQNRKLKVEFFFTTPASSAGTWAVALYQGSTKLALSTDSAGDTVLPSGVTGGKFTAYFDSSSSSSYSLNLVQRTRTSANTLYITNVIVGPGIQPQGAVVGEWASFTPTFGNFTLGNGTTSAFYRRVGANIEVKAYISAGSSTSVTGTLTLTMPLSLNIDGTKIATTGATRETFGIWNIKDNGANNYLGYVTYDTATTVNFTQSGATSVVGATSPITMGTSDSFECLFSLPIAEWSGSGTVQLAQNDVEYASNSKSDSTVSDTTSFAYGPAGSLIPNGAVGTTYSRVVKFQSVIQPTDLFIIQVDQGTGQWVDIDKRLGAYTMQSSISYGVQSEVTDSTTCTVYFGNGGFRATGATYASNGSAWSGISTWRWRLRKMSAGAAVGFGIVSPGVSAGLVSASGLPGNTTGNAIASGYVGEFADGIESTLTNFAGTGAWKQVFAVTLQPGRYNLEAAGFLNLNGAMVTGFALNINTTTATASGLTFPRYYSTSGTSEGSQVYVSRDVNISVATTYYVNIQADYSVATPRYRAYYKWTRIA